MKLLYKINDGEWQEYNMSIPVVNSITINVATATTQTGDVVTHDYDGVYELDYSDYGDIVYVKNGTSISFRDDNYYYPSIGSLVHYGYYDGETGDYVGISAEVADLTGGVGIDTVEIHVNPGDVVQFICDQMHLEEDAETDYRFVTASWDTDFKFNVSGNPKSLMLGEDYPNDDYCDTHGLFADKGVVDASDLIISPNASYDNMFYGCEFLTAAPDFRYVTKTACYCGGMFSYCTSLVDAPALPAKKLTTRCYSSMFSGCSSLRRAPVLHATQLVNGCYSSMFANCTSLENAPAIKATKFPEGSCQYMFRGCTSLTETPYINVMELIPPSYYYNPSNAFYSMFEGCTGLTTIHLNITAEEIERNAFQRMFAGCTSLMNVTFPLAVNARNIKADAFNLMFSGCTSLIDASMTIANAETTMESSSSMNGGCFFGMFAGCTSLAIPPSLKPMKVGNSCYREMFRGCTSLVTAPNLPATSVTESSYYGMFSGCTSLVNVQPVLPAMDLGTTSSSSSYGCYQHMFDGCTSLVTAPELPAETLPFCAYGYMFSGCTSLVNAPSVLPATSIGAPYANWCSSAYGYMFAGCTSLQASPVIMAPTLPDYCAKYMFSGCTSLNYVKCLTVTHTGGSTVTNSTYNWMSGVASTGTFIKHASATWTRNAHGCPTGWTLQNES